MIAQLVWQSYSSVTVKAKSVKVKFAEPFATLEKLVRVAKQGIADGVYLGHLNCNLFACITQVV